MVNLEGFSKTISAPVAQMDRVLPSEGRSRTFESCRARQSSCGKNLRMSRSIPAIVQHSRGSRRSSDLLVSTAADGFQSRAYLRDILRHPAFQVASHVGIVGNPILKQPR